MPKLQRTPEEIDAVRGRILGQAVQLMSEVGFQDFSMRMLARKIKVSPPTLYSYFRNKDELYLFILNEGFTRLHELVQAAYRSTDEPVPRMKAIARAYIDFGLDYDTFYNLMFTWRLPKYKDYLGTSMEPVARIELEEGIQVSELCLKAIRECAGDGRTLSEEDGRILLVHFWSTLHGYVAGLGNTPITYMHEDPRALRDDMLEIVRGTFEREVESRSKKIPRRSGSGP